MADLTIRPANNDQRVVADLIASSAGNWTGRGKPVIQRIVLDAAIATKQPQLARDATSAGIPVVVDPMTFLLQYETSPTSPWSSLNFGNPGAVSSKAFHDTQSKRRLVADVVDFQIANGGSAIIPPYFYARDPRDPVFIHSLTAIKETRRLLDERGSRMPLMPVFCGRADGFTHPASWAQGLDWFIKSANAHGADSIALQLSPLGDFNDSYAKIAYTFQTIQRLGGSGLRIHIWRQGALGPALVATGAEGYETGLQYGNRTDLSALASNRKPRPDTRSRGGSGGQMFVPVLGRWILGAQAELLQGHNATRDLLLCDDPTNCCIGGFEENKRSRREHAARSHARAIARLTAMPPLLSWRMNQVAMDAQRSVDAIDRMNKVLRRGGLPEIKTASHRALARIAENMSKYASSAA